jgi:UDP-glucose 4-epimerase
MRILVTGHRGNVGAPVAAHLARLGHEVVGFDRVEGADLLDLAEVRRAAAGCAAIVHLGALAHDTAGRPEQIMAVNVLGTWHVLLAAETAGVTRVIHFSSAQVFGIADGERLPDYLPVDDAHPDPARYLADPWRALMDCSVAETTLGWRPRYRWSQVPQ